jgi:hypothetical protein
MTGEAQGRGRPSVYSQEIADEICEMLMDGMSLNKICALGHMPKRTTVYNWVLNNSDFRDKYCVAREHQGDYSADYLSDIGEDVRNEVLSADRARVMADIHKWVAARRAPRKYGDQINVNQTATFKTVTDEPLTREERQARWMSQFGNAKPGE